MTTPTYKPDNGPGSFPIYERDDPLVLVEDLKEELSEMVRRAQTFPISHLLAAHHEPAR